MATTTSSIHRANASNGFNVSFQIDHTIGDDHAIIRIMHSSPGRVKNVDLDVPLTEFGELIRSLQMVLDDAHHETWCKRCEGSGEIPALSGMGFPHMRDTCPSCDGKGIVR